jgi:serine/threonine-protein kinase
MNMEPAVGEYVTPNLQLVRRLGAGGMGSVWVARNLGLRSEVVVKFMAPELASDPMSRSRFEREAATASDVRNPHVVQVFDYGVTIKGIPYISMELLEGEDLETRLRREHVIPLGHVAAVLHQAAQGLVRAHERSIIHRDIKPANIFLCDTSEVDAFVKVLDFGIAKVQWGLDAATKTGLALGTPYFMSPEQLMASKALDFRSDLWSLAVVAYAALTGVLPFEGETVVALCMRICAGAFAPPSSVQQSIAPGVDAWFKTALALDPSKRFASVREMADALVSLAGGPMEARIPSRPSLTALRASATQCERDSRPQRVAPLESAGLPPYSVPATEGPKPALPPVASIPHPVTTTQALASTLSAGAPNSATGTTEATPRRAAWMLAGLSGVVLSAAATGGVLLYRASSGSVPTREPPTVSAMAASFPSAPAASTVGTLTSTTVLGATSSSQATVPSTPTALRPRVFPGTTLQPTPNPSATSKPTTVPTPSAPPVKPANPLDIRTE